MAWVYSRRYAGPDRRSRRFAVRLFERRSEEGTELAIAEHSLGALFSRGLRWVDDLNYFGPDRRGKGFSFFFLERRRAKHVGKPPPLATALRQLRVRMINVEGADDRTLLRERLMATALLAEAQGLEEVAQALRALGDTVENALHEEADVQLQLGDELNRIETMLI